MNTFYKGLGKKVHQVVTADAKTQAQTSMIQLLQKWQKRKITERCFSGNRKDYWSDWCQSYGALTRAPKLHLKESGKKHQSRAKLRQAKKLQHH